MANFSREIRAIRRDLGMTQEQFAHALNVSQGTVSRWEKGAEPGFENLREIERLASRRGQPIKLHEMTELPVDDVPVVGEIMAGLFREAIRVDDLSPSINIGPEPRYSGFPRFALRVRGPSMNLLYPDGSFVVCIEFADLGRDPKHGERVIVYRINSDGLIEATCKEFVVDGNGAAWLWPRSSDPHFQTPWPLSNGHPADIESVSVHALVIGSYRPE